MDGGDGLMLAGRLPRVPIKGIILLALFLSTAFAGGWLGARYYSGSSQQAVRYISSESQLIADIAKSAGASVVSVEVERRQNVTDIFGRTFPETEAGAGTGFIIREDGIIMTNRHVVPNGTSDVSVVLSDGTRFDNVRVLGRTRAGSPLDVAFLKIRDLKGKKLQAVKIGDSSRMEIGHRVVAIGNALGQFENTVTSGIISGFGRDIEAYGADDGGETLDNLFQTDAAINQGNSGGPLMNMSGEVIGINTAVAASAQNIGFAIPINDVKGLMESVLSTGKLQEPFLGVRYIMLNDELANFYNVSLKRGAYVLPTTSRQASSIIAGSPADKAGLREKDIITEINAAKLDERSNLTVALSRFKVGDSVRLTVVRDGQTITVEATLAAAPKN